MFSHTMIKFTTGEIIKICRSAVYLQQKSLLLLTTIDYALKLLMHLAASSVWQDVHVGRSDEKLMRQKERNQARN